MSAGTASPETAVGVCELQGEKGTVESSFCLFLQPRGGTIPGRLKFLVSLAC